ncbi:YafY family protein [uncultured Litoreibacter sp.]|uniref:helix-turn-helix transcriptional regulator n=1 Tax=uncultured Litoreibacter sp. TaxID=1392394 RepID=UPI00262F613F|nr:YafY family protein [uncultured Litoreibacter sp.]
MRRADRLFQIVQHLRGGRLTTAADLAERLEVSPRTIYRDVADLMANGVPIDGEAGLGYMMRDGYDLPPLMFTRAEVTALVAGARLIRAWGGAAMALGAENALDKIETILPADALQKARSVHVYAIAPDGMNDVLRRRLDAMEEHIAASERLELSYRDKSGAPTERIVRPLGVWFWGQVWTLVAWCELRNDFRMFRVDRVEEMSVQGRFDAESGKTLSDFLTCEVDKMPNFERGAPLTKP